MTKSPYQILQKPIITEKSLDAKENAHTLCFRVDRRANKKEIAEAVRAVFKVKVDSVRTANYQGKMRRRGRTFGSQPDWKKAFIKLKPGEKMPEYVENV